MLANLTRTHPRSNCHCERSAAISLAEEPSSRHRDCRVASLLAITNWVRVKLAKRYIARLRKRNVASTRVGLCSGLLLRQRLRQAPAVIPSEWRSAPMPVVRDHRTDLRHHRGRHRWGTVRHHVASRGYSHCLWPVHGMLRGAAVSRPAPHGGFSSGRHFPDQSDFRSHFGPDVPR